MHKMSVHQHPQYNQPQYLTSLELQYPPKLSRIKILPKFWLTIYIYIYTHNFYHYLISNIFQCSMHGNAEQHSNEVYVWNMIIIKQVNSTCSSVSRYRSSGVIVFNTSNLFNSTFMYSFWVTWLLRVWFIKITWFNLIS